MGRLVLAYTPVAHTLTVNMTKLAASATARWFDPSVGTYTSISGSPFANTGTRNFTTPGNNSAGDGDWVLVLETQPPGNAAAGSHAHGAGCRRNAVEHGAGVGHSDRQ